MCGRKTIWRCAIAALVLALLPALGIDLLLVSTLMQLSPGVAEVQMRGCMYIGSTVADRGVQRQNQAGRPAINVAVAAMARHPDDLYVQASCGRALETIALFNRDQSLAVADAGGIQAVIDALKANPGSEMIQMMTGCLSSFNDFAPENRPIILRAGGVDLILKAMRNFYHHPRVLFRTGCAISATSGDVGVAEALAAEAEFLVKQMRDHRFSWRVGQEIMQATRNMMLTDPEHRSTLIQVGLPAEVLATVSAEMHERGTPDVGGTNMALLCHGNKTMQDYLVEEGALDLLIQARLRYSAQDSSGFGGITAGEVWPILKSSTQALWALAVNNTDVQDIMLKRQVDGNIINGIIQNQADRVVMAYGCATLRLLAARPGALSTILGRLPNEWCRRVVLGEENMDTTQMGYHLGRV